MYERLIVGYDGKDQSRDALALATMLARAGGGRLLLAWAIRRDFPVSPGSDRFVEAQQNAALALLEEAVSTIPEGLDAGVCVVRGSSPAQACTSSRSGKAPIWSSSGRAIAAPSAGFWPVRLPSGCCTGRRARSRSLRAAMPSRPSMSPG